MSNMNRIILLVIHLTISSNVYIRQSQARIIPSDDHLTVFPDNCMIDHPHPYPYQDQDNCGIQRFDRSFLLYSDDGVYTGIPVTVSCLFMRDVNRSLPINMPF